MDESNTNIVEDKSPKRLGWPSILALCAVGFFINCQPSEAYLTTYLKHDKHLTSNQLDNQVWPYDTYGSFAFLLPIGALAEVAGYRVAIGVGLVCRELTRVLLLFFDGVHAMAAMQLTYAGATAANTIYFAYVYMCVAPDQFIQVTSYIHMAYYLGNALGSLLGQILYTYAHLLKGLFFVSWGFTTLGLAVFLLWFPAPSRAPPASLIAVLRTDGLRGLLETLRIMYSEYYVLAWSGWWIVGLGSHQMIANYYQTQFLSIDEHCESSLGYVEAVMMVFSAAAAMIPRLCSQWLVVYSVPVILGTSLAMAFLYYGATAWQAHLMYSYSFNTAALSLYSFQYAAGSSVIATQVVSARYAILFTVNSFVSYGISTIVQQVGAQHGLSTTDYYIIASIEQLAAVVLVLAVVIGYLVVSKGHSENQHETDLSYLPYHEYTSLKV